MNLTDSLAQDRQNRTASPGYNDLLQLIPCDTAAWLRQVDRDPPHTAIAERVARAYVEVGRGPLSTILRPVHQLELDCTAAAERHDLEVNDRTHALLAAWRSSLQAGIERARGLKHSLAVLSDTVERQQRQVTRETDTLNAESDVAVQAQETRRQECRRLASRLWARLFWRRAVRRRAARVVEAVQQRWDVEIRRRRYQATARAIERALALVNHSVESLSEAEQVLERVDRDGAEFVRAIKQSTSRLPNVHREPALDRLDEIADAVFPEETLASLARQTALGWSANSDLAERVGLATEAVVQAAELPDGVVAHLENVREPERKRLFEVVAAEAEESAAVNVLNAPGNKRWRLRLLHVPGGAHTAASETMGQINPSGAHTRVIDTSFDPAAIVCTIEERALAAAQLVELSQAQQVASRTTVAQREAAVTVWPEAAEVLSFNAERVGDRDDVERLAAMCFALSVIGRKGQATYEFLDPELASRYPVLAAGYENLIGRLGSEDTLRQSVERHVERRRAESGEVRVHEELIRLRSHVTDFVPRDRAARLREIIDREVPNARSRSSSREDSTGRDDQTAQSSWEERTNGAAARSKNGKARHDGSRGSSRTR